MAIVRLTGGLTPPDGSDPRTFPAIWNGAVDDIEAAESDITTLTNRLDTIDTDDVAEGSNLYFTDARADARATAVIGQSTTDNLSEGVTNLYYTDARVDAVIAGSDTDDLSEGVTNLYYTDQRASDAAPVQSVNTQSGAVVLDAGDVGALPGTAVLGDLADVDVAGVADGQLIAYNATNNKWELATPAGITTGDITALNLTWADF